ncbi:MAG: ATP-binding cassette domain-containing protein [Coxiellaceae bacterium]|nr:ATP-binding cassette domain-containing protein [Coxiellaceae bacterium]
MQHADENIIEIEDLKNFLGGHWVHDGVNLSVKRSEIIAIIGGSGCGKTTLLRSILMLREYTAGLIKVFGKDVKHCSTQEAQDIRRRWGVMFQSAALFSSLTLLENVMFPLREFTNLSKSEAEEVARLKIALAGLEPSAAGKYPSELSGGMKKRAALARAIALDPELVFLDEPTAGLDPESAGELDGLLLNMRETLGLTFVMVTHDLDTLWRVPDRVIYLGEGKVLAAMPMDEIVKQQHPLIHAYFRGERSQQRQLLHEEQGNG